MKFSPQSHKEHEGSQSSSDVFHELAKENPVSREIVDCAFKVHKTLGPGLLESAYEECMEKEFLKRQVAFKKQFEMPLFYEGDRLSTPYRVDFLVEDCVLVELKSVFDEFQRALD